MRFDNAKELALHEFLHSQGIEHQFSCPYSYRPEQSYVVEIKRQHLFNVARHFLFQSKTPITFCPVACLALTEISVC